MRRTLIAVGMAGLLVLIASEDSVAQRRGGGFGGARGGGAVVGPQGGVGAGSFSGGTVVGPAGGSRTAGAGSGSVTTKGGSTINYAGAGGSKTTPGGVTAGKGVGGVQVTTPGGKTATKVGSAGGVAGPGGNAVGGAKGATVGTGPGGSIGSAYKGGVAIGPQGGVAKGAAVGGAKGPGGAVAGGTRAAAAVGPYGAAAGRATGARVAGTYYASRAAVAATGNSVRANFRNFAQDYPALTARWVGPTWRPITWAALSSYGSFPAEPVYYDYGETVVYSGETVTVMGETEVPVEQFAQQATDIATAGKEAKVEPKSDDFKPLGVFAMVGKDETNSTNIFQLAVNKEGIIRGEYYNALTDTTETVYGSVDKKTQRAAWTVADRKTPVYEAGIANLTADQTTMLVHFGKTNSQQYMLVRIEQPEGDPPSEKK